MAHPPEGRGRRCILKVAKPFWRAPSFALSYPSGLIQAAQTFKPNRIKSRGSGVLDPQTSASGFSCRGSEPLSKRHGNSGYHCCAGCFNRVAKHWNLGESQGFGGRHRRGEKGGYKVFQMRKAKATPLQLHGWRRRYRRLPPEEIQVFPPWRFSRGLREQSSCKRSGKRPRNGAEELREPPPSRPGTGPSTAEKRLGALRKNRGEHSCRWAGAAVYTTGGRRPQGCQGWHWWPASKLCLTGGKPAGDCQEGGGGYPKRVREGGQEEKEESLEIERYSGSSSSVAQCRG